MAKFLMRTFTCRSTFRYENRNYQRIKILFTRASAPIPRLKSASGSPHRCPPPFASLSCCWPPGGGSRNYTPARAHGNHVAASAVFADSPRPPQLLAARGLCWLWCCFDLSVVVAVGEESCGREETPVGQRPSSTGSNRTSAAAAADVAAAGKGETMSDTPPYIDNGEPPPGTDAGDWQQAGGQRTHSDAGPG